MKRHGKTHFVWEEAAFLAEFSADSVHDDDSVDVSPNESIKSYSAGILRSFTSLLDGVLDRCGAGGDALAGFSEAARDGTAVRGALMALREAVERSTPLFSKLQWWMQWRSPYFLAKIIEEIAVLIGTLEKGDYAILPCFVPGTSGAVMLIDASGPAWPAACTVTVFNSSAATAYHPKLVDPAKTFKIKQRVGLVIPDVAVSALRADATWLFALSVAACVKDERLFYTHLVSHLTGRPFAASTPDADGAASTAAFALACAGTTTTATDSDPDLVVMSQSVFVTPTRARAACFWKNLLHTMKHLLRTRGGLTVAEAKCVRCHGRLGLLARAAAEVERRSHPDGRGNSSRGGLDVCARRLVEAAARLAAASLARSAPLFTDEALQRESGAIDALSRTLALAVGRDDATATVIAPPLLDINSGWENCQDPHCFPLADAFRRLEGVDGLAGEAAEHGSAVPIDLVRVRSIDPTTVSIDDAIHYLSETVSLLAAMAAQSDAHGRSEPLLKNGALAAMALVLHSIVDEFPCPRGPATRTRIRAELEAKRQKQQPHESEADGLRQRRLYGCIWSTPLRKGQQEEALQALGDLAELAHDAFKSVATPFQRAPLCVLQATLAATADALIRVPATDRPSPFTAAYAGLPFGDEDSNSSGSMQQADTYIPPLPFAVDMRGLAKATQNDSFVHPEPLLQRAAVLDYFEEVRDTAPKDRIIFRWDDSTLVVSDEVKCRATMRLLRIVQRRLCIPADAQDPWLAAHGNMGDAGVVALLARYWPSFGHFRATFAFAKGCFLQNHPHERQCFGQFASRISVESRYGVHFEYGSRLTFRDPDDEVVPTACSPDTLLGGALERAVEGEDDILHIPTLPSIGSCAMGQRDVELFLSYLTVPYLRIPLLLRFFATEDRVAYLLPKEAHSTLFGALLEPALFLPATLARQCPVNVPSENPALIATPHGLLLNELRESPAAVADSVVRLLRLARELDAGTVFNDETRRVCHLVVMIALRIENYVACALAAHEACVQRQRGWRDAELPSESEATLRATAANLRRLFNEEIIPMHMSWIDETLVSQDHGSDWRNFLAMSLHANIVLLFRNVRPDEYTEVGVKAFLASFATLTARRAWMDSAKYTYRSDQDELQAHSDLDLYEVAERHRRPLLRWLYTLPPATLASVMEHIVSVATNAARTIVPTASADGSASQVVDHSRHRWGVLGSGRGVGRFGRLKSSRVPKTQHNTTNDSAALPMIGSLEDPASAAAREALATRLRNSLGIVPHVATPVFAGEGDHDVEFSLQTLLLTVNASQLQPMPDVVANEPDVCEALAPTLRDKINTLSALQVAVIERTQHRLWIRLVAQDHDVQAWTSPDPRVPLPVDMERFYPDDLAASESWAVSLFEPVRKSYLERPFWETPVFYVLPSTPLTADGSVVTVQVVCSGTGRRLKEAHIFRDLATVQVYAFISHGRRFYRSLQIATDTRFCLHELDVATSARQRPWPAWARHLGVQSHYRLDCPVGGQSAVITRSAAHPLNVSRSTETFLPSRLFNGLLPDALLSTHHFWQDDDDNIRGYPVPPEGFARAAEKEEEARRQTEDGAAAADAAASTNEGGHATATGTDTHMLWLHWREGPFAQFGASAETVLQVFRYPDARTAPRSSEEAVARAARSAAQVAAKRARRAADDATVEDEVGMMRTASSLFGHGVGDGQDGDGGMDDDLVRLTSGAYRQASMVATAADDETHGSHAQGAGSASASIEDNTLLLLNLVHAREGTPLHSLAKLLVRLEKLSHILVWTTDTDYGGVAGVSRTAATLALIQLPRIKMSFAARLPAHGSTEFELFSIDHCQLFVSNTRQAMALNLLRGIPHGIVLQDVNDGLSLLVPSCNVVRPPITEAPFSTELVVLHGDEQWRMGMETCYYLYPVHVSLSFLFTPTLASALYLLLLRFLYRDHADVFRLVGSIVSDAPYTREESGIAQLIVAVKDDHPDALSCRAKMVLMQSEARPDTTTENGNDGTDAVFDREGWFLPVLAAAVVRATPHISVDCRLTASQERGLLEHAYVMTTQMLILTDEVNRMSRSASGADIVGVFTRSVSAGKREQRRACALFVHRVAVRIRRVLGLRTTAAGLRRLLLLSNRFGERPPPLDDCLLHNRRAFLCEELAHAEAVALSASASDGGPVVRRIQYRVPPIGDDPKLLFAHDFEAATVKVPPFAHQMNDERRSVELGTKADWYYCKSLGQRKGKCPCGRCSPQCGPISGCVCDSCERFNRVQRTTLRHAPVGMDLPTTFGRPPGVNELVDWMGAVVSAWQHDCLTRKNAVRDAARQTPEERRRQAAIASYGQPPTARTSLRDPSRGFFWMYELITRRYKIKVHSKRGGGDTVHALLKLMTPFYREVTDPGSALGHVAAFMVQSPEVWHLLPVIPKSISKVRTAQTQQRVADVFTAVVTVALAHEKATVSRLSSLAALPPYGTVTCTDTPTAATVESVDSQQQEGEHLSTVPKEGEEEASNDLEEGELYPADAEDQNGCDLPTACSRSVDQEALARALHERGFHKIVLSTLLRGDSRGVNVPLEHTVLLPVSGGTDCPERTIRNPTLSALVLLGDEAIRFSDSTDAVLRALTSVPLASVTPEGCVRVCTRQDLGVPLVSEHLPFDLSRHETAQTALSRDTLKRMEAEMGVYARGCNGAPQPHITGLASQREVRTLLQRLLEPRKPATAEGADTEETVATVLTRVEGLLTQLRALRHGDSEFVTYALPAIERTANHVPTGAFPASPVAVAVAPHSCDSAAERASTAFRLRRHAGREPLLSLEFLLASLCSRGAEHQWCQLNPFLSATAASATMDLVALTLLRANRVGHANRAVEAATDLAALLRRAADDAAATAASPVPPTTADEKRLDAFVAAICQKADSLAACLTTRRVFMSGDDKDNNDTAKTNAAVQQQRRLVCRYDPRFLLFEFLWNIVLRERQRELVIEMRDSVESGVSLVKQMIMGAGKTTCVGPLLAMMLADGKNLVLQVVPQALLDFSRSVMRATFSGIVQKQVFSFSADRGSPVGAGALRMLESARLARGVVVTTPSTVKSVFLKYIEGLDRTVNSHPPSAATAPADATASSAAPAATTPNPAAAPKVNPSEGDSSTAIVPKSTVGAPEAANVAFETQDLHRILLAWRKSVLIMDEIDSILHPLRSELNFPTGQKFEIDFAPVRWRMPIHLIDAVFFAQTGRLSVSLKEAADTAVILRKLTAAIREGLRSNALQEMPHLVLLNLGFYDTRLKPLLALWLLHFLHGQHVYGLSDADTVRYLCGRASQKEEVPAGETRLVDRVEALDKSHRQLLNLAFDWLNCFLPHALQKIDRVSFGIMNSDDMDRARNSMPNMPASRFVTAIPFVGKDLPSDSSEFAHPDVVIGLTIFAYRYEGLRSSDFNSVMNNVFRAVEKEVGRFALRRSNVMYSKWVAAAGGQLLVSYDYTAAQQQPSATSDAADGKNARLLSSGDVEGMQPAESLGLISVHSFAAGGGGGGGDDAGGNDSAMDEAVAQTLPPSGTLVLPLKLLKQADRTEFERAFKLLRRTPDVIHWWLCETVFPDFMRHHRSKLSASGQELGGNMIFDRRVGFSGTPSDLLPVELGRCGYEKGTDGQLVHTLTNPDVVSLSFAPNGWTVRALLDVIAHANPPFHALIDTGALITGMSNLQVARYLLKNGLPQIEGVVFLDELDRKMILVRATGRVLKLGECGIPKVKRFAFYDQVHTTGMDIDHTPNAQAVQTLGKDMTFRDFSQGAYRMRGIAQGQTVHLLIIPEVYDLINRSLAGVRKAPLPALHHRASADILRDVTAWLVVNSMRSEHVQHNQLSLQNCANVWRKEAFGIIQQHANAATALGSRQSAPQKTTDGAAETAASAASTPSLSRAIGVFQEPVDFDVVSIVPQPRMFSETIRTFVAAHADVVTTAAGRGVVDSLIDRARREDEIDAPFIDVQMVQEQEEEREQEQEQEREQEVEMEQFVEMQFSRQEESQRAWDLATLANPSAATQFYPLREFHLFKRRAIDFPESILLSRNYFSPRWTGHRRMKNVVVTVEWIPSQRLVRRREAPTRDYNTIPEGEALEVVKKAVAVATAHQGGIDAAVFQELAVAALAETAPPAAPTKPASSAASPAPESQNLGVYGTKPWLDVVGGLFAGGASDAPRLHDTDTISTHFLRFLRSNALRNEEDGRRTVAVSLAEAETLRRVLHVRRVSGEPIVPGCDVALALRIVPAQNAILDATPGFLPEEQMRAQQPATAGQTVAAGVPASYSVTRDYNCLRYFDCDVLFTDPEVALALRALHGNDPRLRQCFFQQVLATRRRSRHNWVHSPVALLFTLPNALTLWQQKTVALCIRRELDARALNPGDAFVAFNHCRSGSMIAEELWGALRFCRLESLTADDVLDFLEVADSRHEMSLQYPDFLAMVTGRAELDESTEGGGEGGGLEASAGKNLPTVLPYGAEEVGQRRADRARRNREAEAEANERISAEAVQFAAECDAELAIEELAALRSFGSPVIGGDDASLVFTFGSLTETPMLLGAYGDPRAGAVRHHVDFCTDVARRVEERAKMETVDPTVARASKAAELKQRAQIRAKEKAKAAGDPEALREARRKRHAREERELRGLAGATDPRTCLRVLRGGSLGLHLRPLALLRRNALLRAKHKPRSNDDSEAAVTDLAGLATHFVADFALTIDFRIGLVRHRGSMVPISETVSTKGTSDEEWFLDLARWALPWYEPQESRLQCESALWAEEDEAHIPEAEDATHQPGGSLEERRQMLEDSVLHVFSEPFARSSLVVGHIRRGELVRSKGNHAVTTVDGVEIEWMHIDEGPTSAPDTKNGTRRPAGWIVLRHAVEGVTCDPWSAAVVLDLRAHRVTIAAGPTDRDAKGKDASRVLGTARHDIARSHAGTANAEASDDDDYDSEADDGYSNQTGNDEGDEEKTDGNRSRLGAELADLLERVSVVRTFSRDDLVVRDETMWEHGDDDGGAGTIGRVVRAEGKGSKVTVLWPSCQRSAFDGSKEPNGRPPLRKVPATVTNIAAARTPLRTTDTNQRKHARVVTETQAALAANIASSTNFKKMKKMVCGECKAEIPPSEMGDWFLCNDCDNFSLCRPCFDEYEHNDHTFSCADAVAKAVEASAAENGNAAGAGATSAAEGVSQTDGTGKASGTAKAGDGDGDSDDDDDGPSASRRRAARVPGIFNFEDAVCLAPHVRAPKGSQLRPGAVGYITECDVAARTATVEFEQTTWKGSWAELCHEGLPYEAPKTSEELQVSATAAAAKATNAEEEDDEMFSLFDDAVSAPAASAAAAPATGALAEGKEDAEITDWKALGARLVPALSFVGRRAARCEGLASLVAAATRPFHFMPGDDVIVATDGAGQNRSAHCAPDRVAALLPLRRFCVLTTAPPRTVPFAALRLLGMRAGDSVRLRRFEAGEHPRLHLPIPVERLARSVGTIAVVEPGSRARPFVVVEVSFGPKLSYRFADVDLVVVSGPQAPRWFFVDRSNNNSSSSGCSPALLSRTLARTIDTAFLDGKRQISFPVGGAAGPSGDAKPKPRSCTVLFDESSAGPSVVADGVAVGTLIREPHQQWQPYVTPRTFDDGAWHTFSLIVRRQPFGGVSETDTESFEKSPVVALCDGLALPIHFESDVSEIVDALRYFELPRVPGEALTAAATAGSNRASLAVDRALSAACRPFFFPDTDFGEDGQKDDGDEQYRHAGSRPLSAPSAVAALRATGFVLADFLALTPAAAPSMQFAHCYSRNAQSDNVPPRFISSLSLRWGSGKAIDPREAMCAQQAAEVAERWPCPECRSSNDRWALCCTMCGAPRGAPRGTQVVGAAAALRRRRAAVPAAEESSREAREARQHLHNRLRDICQRELAIYARAHGAASREDDPAADTDFAAVL